MDPESLTSFPAAYLRFLPSVRAKCRRLLGSDADAEEVAHESFVRLWEWGPAVGEGGDARTVMAWLYRTSTRLALDALRRRKRRQELTSVETEMPCSVSLEALVAARHLVRTLVRSVPADILEAAVLCRVDGVSHVEAAEVLGVSERTVRRLLDRFDDHATHWRQENAS